MAETGGRKKWIVRLSIVVAILGVVLGWFYGNRPLIDRATLLKDAEALSSDGRVWLPDQRRWLTVGEDSDYSGNSIYPVLLHSLDRPDIKGKVIEAPPPIRSLQGVTTDYRLIASNWTPGAAHVTLYEMGINDSVAPERNYSMSAPRNAIISGLAVSPKGDQMAWLFNYNRPMPFASILTRIFPKLNKNIHGVGLWVSRLDGKDLREIGYQSSDEKNNVTFDVQDIHWLPDNRRVRFTFKNVNYVVPVN